MKQQFKNDLFFLSNMFKMPIQMSEKNITPSKLERFKSYFKFDNCIYPSTENLYQALKNKQLNKRFEFLIVNPFEAKKLGRQISRNDIIFGWDMSRLIAMEICIDLKFNSYKYLAENLINTPDEDIVEWNTWGDTFWGKCLNTLEGADNLGKILRAKKYELQNTINTINEEIL